MNYENAFYIGITITFNIACFSMGSKLSILNIITTMKNNKCNIIQCLFHSYVSSPLIALLTIKIFNINYIYSISICLFSITPPTIAASFATYAIDGDHSLSICLSFISLVVGLLIMPFIFSLQLLLLNSSNVNLQLPILEMILPISSMFSSIFFGILFKEKTSQNIIKKTNSVLSLLIFLGFIFCIIMFVLIQELIDHTFNSSKLIYVILSYILTHFIIVVLLLILTKIPKNKAFPIICTSCRKNSSISLTIGALTFKNTLNHNNTVKAIGALSLFSMLLDINTLFFLLCYYIHKKFDNRQPILINNMNINNNNLIEISNSGI
tara:strand:+ start:892 stop:1860 length:969 start_codon:yes stop_codon:yes gene_type:complete